MGEIDSVTMQEPKSAPKKPLLKDIDDVVSIGALLRPTFLNAISSLSLQQKEEFLKTLVDIEKELSNSSVSLTSRFGKVNSLFTRSFAYAPIWRFIAGKIEDVGNQSPSPSVKELSMVSLLIGMMFEETQSQLQSQTSKARQSA
jgi:hypothetical protein